MPTLIRAANIKELEKLVSIYLKAETDIINEIGRLRAKGLVDYHVVAALERIQAILRKMESDTWEYAPKMIEKQFYVRVPEARKELEIPETPEKHAAGYANAAALTGDQMDLVQSLTQQLMAEITDATMTAMASVLLVSRAVEHAGNLDGCSARCWPGYLARSGQFFQTPQTGEGSPGPFRSCCIPCLRRGHRGHRLCHD